jgi:hypothetical protein
MTKQKQQTITVNVHTDSENVTINNKERHDSDVNYDKLFIIIKMGDILQHISIQEHISMYRYV